MELGYAARRDLDLLLIDITRIVGTRANTRGELFSAHTGVDRNMAGFAAPDSGVGMPANSNPTPAIGGRALARAILMRIRRGDATSFVAVPIG